LIICYPDCAKGVGCRCQAASCSPGKSQEAAAIDAKLAALEEWGPASVRYLIDWLREEAEPLLAMAKGRHAEGHYRYGDTVMYEYSQDVLRAEAAQELADAINYVALLLRRT
jgi:hypothetical protein